MRVNFGQGGRSACCLTPTPAFCLFFFSVREISVGLHLIVVYISSSCPNTPPPPKKIRFTMTSNREPATRPAQEEPRQRGRPSYRGCIRWSEVDWNGPSRVFNDDETDPLTVPPRPQSRGSEVQRRAGSESQRSEEPPPRVFDRFWAALRRFAPWNRNRPNRTNPDVFHRFCTALRRTAS